MFKVPNNCRITTGPMGSTNEVGNNGAFFVKIKSGLRFKVIASDEGGWEHVSVSLNDRTPRWEEMAEIKNIFWDEDDCVIQYHPPKSEYINYHPFCLHMWRPTDQEIPLPPSIFVGIKGLRPRKKEELR